MKKLGNVFILGDSYSTFEGYIPEGYAAYYKKEPTHETDVTDVTNTWWYQLLDETDSKLLRNCSRSGTVICHTGYDGRDCRSDSFTARFNKLSDEGYFEQNKIDTFFLFGGTNDTWADSPLGETMDGGWTEEDLFKVRPAISYLVDKIVKTVEGARVYCIINTDLKPEITSCFKAVCSKHGVKCIELKNIDKISGHPTIKGMQQIKNQVYTAV